MINQFAMFRRCATALLAIPVLAVALLAAPGLALAEEDTEMVVGGKPAPDGKFPYQVRLYASMEDDKGFCGGSIIDPQWILTAGHCVVEDNDLTENLQPVDTTFVGYGSTDRTQTTKIESEAIFVHPGYLAHALANPNGGIEVVEAMVRRDNRRELDERIRALAAALPNL